MKSYPPDKFNITSEPITAYFQAFSGNACDGGQGGQITFAGESDCLWTDGRHSFYVGAGPDDDFPVIAYLYDELNCQGNENYNNLQAYTCYNVNTGGNWRSAKIWATGSGI